MGQFLNSRVMLKHPQVTKHLGKYFSKQDKEHLQVLFMAVMPLKSTGLISQGMT